jgi:8-oxo-dGTP pyrophosphatase MutT (NUDIX family)
MIAQVYDPNFIRRQLASHQPEVFKPQPSTRQAAVAIILRKNDSGSDILFIQRADKPGDPWSGHMAFPGGHLDPEDEDLRAAAVRETWEEVGLDLSSADYLGAVDQQLAMPRGRQLNMLIAPHVFEIDGDPAFSINYEVAEVVWTELGPLVSGERHDTETKPMAGKPTVFNGYRLERGHFVWGLTYRMLKSFFSVVDPHWQPPPEL